MPFEDSTPISLAHLLEHLGIPLPETKCPLPPGRDRAHALLTEMVTALKSQIEERRAAEVFSAAAHPASGEPQPTGVGTTEVSSVVRLTGGQPSRGITPPPVPDVSWKVLRLQKEMVELRNEMTGLKQQVRELRASRPEGVPVVPVNATLVEDAPTAGPATVSFLEMVQIGILPENITEEAWPLLKNNLEKAGVPVPEVVAWVSRETLSHLVDAFTKHCRRVHL